MNPSGDRQSRHNRLVQVAIPSPLFRLFDYRLPPAMPLVIGGRVKVSFGRRTAVGMVVAQIKSSDVPEAKLKGVLQALDQAPLLPAEIMTLLTWAARYYHHPLGEVLTSALPVLLRRGDPAELGQIESFVWGAAMANASDVSVLPDKRRAPLQHALAHALISASAGLPAATLRRYSPRWRSALKPLIDKGLVQQQFSDRVPQNTAVEQPPELMPEQSEAVATATSALGDFKAILVDGVTGSGKTEVYLQIIRAALERGEQVLVMVPEISLTPQLLQRFARRISGCLVTLHSALNDTERRQHWLLAAHGHADVVIGTRSSVWVPMPRLGLIVIDEEHDGSLKQQDGFRYHARDLAVIRARNRSCPVVLGSATPSFESLNNVATERFTGCRLLHRAGDAMPPTLTLLDIRRRPLIEGLSDRLLDRVKHHLDEGGQVLLFINRRGYAPTLICNCCGDTADCRRCDAHMTVHARKGCLRCHHCGAERPLPTQCERCAETDLDSLGYGTERIENVLRERFPDVSVLRIDRDTTRRKGSLEAHLEEAVSGRARLLVGTQMLAKGHHFPNVTLVGVLDADRGLFGTDFRALETMGQQILQVAGRAGREARAGHVLIQTRNPDNPILQTLVNDGYSAFARTAMDDRKAIAMPPYAHVALIRAEATDTQVPLQFLESVAQFMRAQASSTVASPDVLGPVPAPMERLAGRFRAQLLLHAADRATINRSLSSLTSCITEFPAVRQVRWSIDVDPVDLF